MEKLFVKEIKENSRIESVFLVKEKNVGVTKNGNPYMNLILMDRTGEIAAKVWDNVESLDRIFKKDDFVKVKSRALLYQGNLQLNISFLEKYPEDNIDISDFLPTGTKDREAMFLEIKAIIEKINDAYLKQLLNLFFSDDEEITALFKKSPAAKGMHHVFIGGLLEHTLSVARLAKQVTEHYSYPGLNADLLITGALLHDIGKIYELSCDRSFDYTDIGRLLGHITLGVEIIAKKISLIDGFPNDLAVMLKHLILSHHGEYLYGSPKKPKTLEALILYYIDDLDAKIAGFKSFIEQDKDQDSKWTKYHKLYERYIYKKAFLSQGEEKE